jgi:hypothetical protein
VFGGGFLYDDQIYRPDLALIAKNWSHWFVIEVELASHSLERHVLPQVLAFQYGTLLPDCSSALARALRVDLTQAQTLTSFVPRSVAVIANKRDIRWEAALRAYSIQFLALSILRSSGGLEALEIDGTLEVVAQNLGFGQYSATDRSLRFHRGVALPEGCLLLEDRDGAPAEWDSVRTTDGLWLTKRVGVPDLENSQHYQVIRTIDGRLSLRRPGAALA